MHGKHSRRSTLEVKVVSARRLHRCRLQQPAALHPGLVDIIDTTATPLPYLTSYVDRLLHLPSAEAVSAWPNARPRM